METREALEIWTTNNEKRPPPPKGGGKRGPRAKLRILRESERPY
jgi:hypothetical protein